MQITRWRLWTRACGAATYAGITAYRELPFRKQASTPASSVKSSCRIIRKEDESSKIVLERRP
jgi:hypothetical protein